VFAFRRSLAVIATILAIGTIIAIVRRENAAMIALTAVSLVIVGAAWQLVGWSGRRRKRTGPPER